MTKAEIRQQIEDRAAYVLAHPGMLVEELAEHFGFGYDAMIQSLYRWRKAGLIPKDFKKYHCRRLKDGSVNRTGVPVPEEKLKSRQCGWKIRPPKPKPRPARPAKASKVVSNSKSSQLQRTTVKLVPKQPLKRTTIKQSSHAPQKVGRCCSNGKAGVFTVTHNPDQVAIHDRDAGKVLVKIDSRTWKYVSPEKAAAYQSGQSA